MSGAAGQLELRPGLGAVRHRLEAWQQSCSRRIMSTCQVVAETIRDRRRWHTASGRNRRRRWARWIRSADRDRLRACLGGTAAAVTRYLVGNADPHHARHPALGHRLLLRAAGRAWPARALAAARRLAGAWPLLGICFFGLFFILYNIAVSYTTAARASLALSTLPLQTMLIAALLRYRAADAAQDRPAC